MQDVKLMLAKCLPSLFVDLQRSTILKFSYMSKNEFGADMRLRILVLDSPKTLLLVITQRCLDVVETGGFDIVDVIGKDDCVLHCIHCSCATAWEEFVCSYWSGMTCKSNE